MVQPVDRGIEADGDEHGQAEQDEDLPKLDDEPREGDRDEHSERADETDEERRPAVKGRSCLAEPMLRGSAGFDPRRGVDVIDGVLGVAPGALTRKQVAHIGRGLLRLRGRRFLVVALPAAHRDPPLGRSLGRRPCDQVHHYDKPARTPCRAGGANAGSGIRSGVGTNDRSTQPDDLHLALWCAHADRVGFTAQGMTQDHEGGTADEPGNPERDRPVGEDRSGGCGDRYVVEDERADEAGVDAADAAGDGDQAAQLADQVSDRQDPERRWRADRTKRRPEDSMSKTR